MNQLEQLETKINLLSKEENPKLFKEYSKLIKCLDKFSLSKDLSPLEIANRDYMFYLTKFILENNLGDVNEINLHYTVINKAKKFFDLYIKHGINPNLNGAFITSFDEEKKKGHYFKTIIKHPEFDINTVGLESNHLGDNNTYLMYASIDSNIKQYKDILEKTSPELISIRNDRDKSAAYFAFEFGYKNKIKALLAHKPILTEKDLSKLSPKHISLLSDYYDEETVKNFIEIRKGYLINLVKDIIQKIENDNLNFLLSEEKMDYNKEDLYPFYRKVQEINHDLALDLYDDDISKSQSLDIFNKLLEEI